MNKTKLQKASLLPRDIAGGGKMDEEVVKSSSPLTGVSFPIVGVGASAGGLEAFTQLLGELPPDTGMAFVLIQHLDPTHTSFLADALTKSTTMRVTQAKDGER